MGDFAPNWSPNGSRIAFTRDQGGNKDIFVMNAGGTGQRRLTKKAASDADPVWSPAGTRIAFRSERGGDPEVYVMKPRPEGKKNRSRNLTANNMVDSDPNWQPIL